MNTRARLTTAVSGVLAIVVLAACGSDDDGATTTDEADTAEAPVEDPAEQTDSAGVRVDLAGTDLGEILVDGEGRTLYLFTVDEPGQSNCEDECLDAWPPLEGEAEAGDGVDAGLLGTIERADGTVQATYADWPLYYYAGDDVGDLNGQGLNDAWYVIDGEGNAVEEAADEDSGY